MFSKIDCWFKTVWYSLKYLIKTADLAIIMGHTYVIKEVHQNCTVEIAYCEDCGNMSIPWYHGEANIQSPMYLAEAKLCRCLKDDMVRIK